MGAAADVYSLGAVLYELMTGRPPFKADSAVETLRQVLDDDPAPPRLLNAAVPLDLETVCLKCLRKEPEGRYATSAAVADDLGRFLSGEPILARPLGRVTRVWRWSKRKPAAAAAAITTLVAVGPHFRSNGAVRRLPRA